MAKIPIPIRVCAAYFIFGCLWIVLSDSIAHGLARGSIDSLSYIEKAKGIVFVALSSFLIYIVSYRPYKRLSSVVKEYRLLIQKNKAIQLASKEGIYELDLSKNRVSMNKNLARIVGKSVIDVSIARNLWKEGIHPDQRERILNAFDEAEKKGKVYWREEYLFKVNDRYRDILHSVYFIKGNNQQLHSLVGAIQDLTKHRSLEREFHQQQLKTRDELTRAVIKTEEKEKNRWAEELHDNIGQVLGVASLYTGLLKHPESNITEVSDKLKEMIDLSVNEIRQLSSNLKPPRLEHGLKYAIETLVANLQRLNQVFRIRVCCSGEELLNDDQKIMVYRVVQEQLNNTFKYASATNVKIEVSVNTDHGILLISDDGQGFDTDKARRGIGLKNIQNRLEAFRGHVEIKSSPGNGCQIIARFPVCGSQCATLI